MPPSSRPAPAPGAGRNACWIDALAAEARPAYDPAARLLRRRPGVAENVHSEYLADLATRPRHLTRESAIYALLLLEQGDAAGAQAIIDRVLEVQHRASDPADPLDGLWHYFAEESVRDWPYVDFNWADFIALHLLLAVVRHGPALGEERTARIEAALGRAGSCILRRHRRGDVPVSYTNIYLMGAVVLLAAGERLGRPDLAQVGRERFVQLHAEVVGAGRVSEYNSPVYTGVCLGVLGAARLLLADADALASAAEIETTMLRHVARRFHPATLELAGPHSRGYFLHLAEHPGALGVAFDLLTEGELRLAERHRDLPPDHRRLHDMLTALQGPLPDPVARRMLADRARSDWIEERCGDVTLRTCLEPAFCLGSVDHQDGWEQRRNLLAYSLGADGRSLALQWRWLRDDRPCCSGFFVSHQHRGEVLFAGVLGEFTDHHLHVPADGGVGAFFGPVLGFEGDASTRLTIVRPGRAPAEVGPGCHELGPGVIVALRTASAWIAVTVLEWTAHPSGGTARLVPDPETGGGRIEFPLLEASAPVRFRWRDWTLARAVCALRIAAAGPDDGWNDWLADFGRSRRHAHPSADGTTHGWNDLRIVTPNGLPPRTDWPPRPVPPAASG